MNLKEFEKRKNSIWAKYEKEYGSPIAHVIRDRIEEEVIRLSMDDPETLDDLDRYLGENIPIWKTLLSKGDTSPAKDSAKAKPQNRYRKCFERRFYLVNFVMDRPYKRGTLIDWKRMVSEWNEAHPSDPMSLSTLRVEYQRAIKEDVLMLQVFIIRKGEILATAWRPLKERLRDMAKNNPFSFAIASFVSQKLWNDSQSSILFLIEIIRESPLFKEIESFNPEATARLNSKLEAIKNMGDINELIQEINNLKQD